MAAVNSAGTNATRNAPASIHPSMHPISLWAKHAPAGHGIPQKGLMERSRSLFCRADNGGLCRTAVFLACELSCSALVCPKVEQNKRMPNKWANVQGLISRPQMWGQSA